ncbi:unnamed protein product [Pleuronectes platessa]|uniref:Uncharacterized protein n=1 Tax=Pleuronectes platessa TaxID=8262 RepID=A0A9N7V3S0_PLEPL|nr:unnamed protein product [Pleuronectes platessa]
MDMTREDMYALVSSTMDQAQRDINDLRNSISGWTAEEHAMSMDHYDGSTLGPVTLQKVDEYLEGFFAKKRRQWRELSEGEYNEAVKELLVSMGVDMMSVISESIIRITLQSMSQLPNRYEKNENTCEKLCRTSDGDAPDGVDQNERERLIVGVVDFLMNKYSLKTYLDSFTKLPDTSSTAASERLSSSKSDMQKNVEICLIQAFSDVIGEDIPGRISCEFTEAIVTEVMDVVNSVTSMAKQQLLDTGSFSAFAPPSIQLSGVSEARTLAGAIMTMESFLTGRTHEIMIDEAQEEEEEATIGTTSPLISTEEGDDSDREIFTILETEAYSSPSRESEEVFEVAEKLGTDNTEEEEEATMGTSSNPISMEEEDHSDMEIITILETEAYSSPSSASEEVFEVAEKFGTDNTEEEEEATMGKSSTPISIEEGDDSDMETITILETEAYSSPSRASVEIKDAISIATSFAILQMFEADISDISSDLLEQVKLDEAQEKEEEAKLGTKSPLISKEEGDDSGKESISILETEAYSSTSTASEEVFEVAERFEADNTETASDVNEQIRLDEAQEEEEEATMGTTSTLISKEGDDSGRESISILETESYSSLSRASEEVFEVAERFEADNTETASDLLEQMKVDEAQEEVEEATMGTTSPLISKEEGDDSDRETISIPETKAYCSCSRASDEIQEEVSSANSEEFAERFEADNTEIAADFNEQIRLDDAQEEEEEAKLGTTSPLIFKEEEDDSDTEIITLLETEAYPSPSRASEEVFEVAERFEADNTETASTPISMEEGDDSDMEIISISNTEADSSPSRASDEIQEAVSSANYSEVAERFEADNTETASDVNEQLILDEAQEEEEEATMGTTSPLISKEGDDSDRESISILETEASSSPSRASEEVFEVAERFVADNTEIGSDVNEQLILDEAQEEEEELTMGTTSPLISKEGDDSDRESISILETEAYSSPSRASEEVFEDAERFEAHNTDTFSDLLEQMKVDEAQEEEEELTMGTTSPLISKEGDDSDRESISIPETEAYSSPSRASEEVFEVAERFEADNTETFSDFLEQMKVDEAQEEEEELTMGTTSPLISKEGDDSDRESISIPETEAYSSPSRASEEVFEVAERFEADNTETFSDFLEQMKVDEAQEEEEELTMGTTSPLISKEEGDDSESEMITIPETKAYCSPSRASDEIQEDFSSAKSSEVAERFEADNTEMALDFNEQVRLDEAQEEAKLRSISPLISKEEEDDSDRETISIIETEAYSSPSRASEEVFEVAEKFEANNTATASDLLEPMEADEAQEKEEEATMETTSPIISKEEGDDSEREIITMPETKAYSSPSRASDEIQEVVPSANSSQVAERLEADNTATASDFLEQMKLAEAQEKVEEANLESTSPPAPSSAFSYDASEETPTLTSRNSSTSEPVENEDIRELTEGDADQDLRERMINMSAGVMNMIVNAFPYSSSSQSIRTLANAFRSSKREKRSNADSCLSSDESDSPE